MGLLDGFREFVENDLKAWVAKALTDEGSGIIDDVIGHLDWLAPYAKDMGQAMAFVEKLGTTLPLPGPIKALMVTGILSGLADKLEHFDEIHAAVTDAAAALRAA